MSDRPPERRRVLPVVALLFATWFAGGVTPVAVSAPTGLAVPAPCTGPAKIPESPPAKGKSYRDPDYGACVIRLTDHNREPPIGFARNDYSRRQPFNADESRALIYARDGSWHLYDPRNGDYIQRLPFHGADSEPQWDAVDPQRLYYLPNHGGLEIDALNTATGKSRVAADFLRLDGIAGHPDADSLTDIWPDAAHVWTRTEGSPSHDMRYWAFQVENREFHTLGIITYDLSQNRIVGIYDLTRDGGGIGRPDHVSMSPNGQHVVVSWNGAGMDCPAGRQSSRSKPCGLMAFSPDFSRATALASRGPHSDLALTADGRDVIVIANYVSGNVEMIDLSTGQTTVLWRIYTEGSSTAMHISGKAFQHPGWVLISTYALRSRTGARPWYTNKLMAVELTAQPRIVLLASIPTRADSYFSEPQAAVDRRFRQALFNANWGSGRDSDIDTYLLQLPPHWDAPKSLPAANSHKGRPSGAR